MQEKKEVGGRKKALDCSVIDPFLTVESNKETLINMIPKLTPLSYPHSGLDKFKKWSLGDHFGNIKEPQMKKKQNNMLKIKQSVKTLVSVAPRSVIPREHCTWSFFTGRSATLQSPSSL